MRRARAALILPLAILMACSDKADEPEVTANDIAEAETAGGIPTEPDQATADAYIAALNAIDPRIVGGDVEQAIDRGRDACSTITDASGQMPDVDAVNLRFTSPDAPTGWSPEIAEQILTVVRQHLCP